MPASSNSLLVAAMAISVVSTLASAVAICAAATVSPVGSATARSMARPATSRTRVGGVGAQLQVADRLDRVGVLPGVVDAAVDPGARLGAHEVDGVVDRRAGDAEVDRGLDDLEDRAVGGRLLVALVAGHEMGLRHLDVLERSRCR